MEPDDGTGASHSPTSAGGPLQTTTPDRVNRGESRASSRRSQSRESTVHEKISQFNNMSVSMQSRALERKTADAALKRALVGREEAESEARRLKEETRTLRKAIDEGKERERRVGERLEAVMENFGRAKETHAHTQSLWEKEIRRARKENFKAQSSIVKLQEELKTSRETTKTLQESVQRDKERILAREQEAHAARLELATLQEELDKTLDKVKVLEQERDAYKAAAKAEEIARIAAEGRLPLPACDDPDDEFASPPKKKARRESAIVRNQNSRVSLTSMEIVSSAASEMEIEELSEQVQWERQRADRAQEMVEFMQAECLMHCCPCSKSKRRTSMLATQEHQQDARRSPAGRRSTEETEDHPDDDNSDNNDNDNDDDDDAAMGEPADDLGPPRSKKDPRLSTLFFPKEGIFRTVSEQEATTLEAKQEAEIVSRAPKDAVIMDASASRDEADKHLRLFARTPSAEPPTFALHAQERTSLLSLVNAPRREAFADAVPVPCSIPNDRADTEPAQPRRPRDRDPARHQRERNPDQTQNYYTVTTTTTKVPVRDTGSGTSSSLGQRVRALLPSTGSSASFDTRDPAMTPTVTREEALAMIRDRRGRARSATQLATGPSLKGKTKERRDMSAPTEHAAKKQRRS